MSLCEFSPDVHTAEALKVQIESLHQNNPSSILVGSLGRAVLYGRVVNNPYFEFQARNEDPLFNKAGVRDIDIVSEDSLEPADGPFQVDTACFKSKFNHIVNQNGDWYLVSEAHGFAEQLHPDIVEPIEGKSIYDISTKTLPAQTQREMFGLKNFPRPKDIWTRAILKKIIIDKQDDNLPKELFGPFQDLRRLNRRHPRIMAQNTYRLLVPKPARLAVKPAVSRIRHAFDIPE